jgi:hypothetical protein
MKPRKILISGIPAFLVLILSFFIDVSYVPVLGDMVRNIQSFIYPESVSLNKSVIPISLWWVNFFIYFLTIVPIVLAFVKLDSNKEKLSSSLIDIIIKKYKRMNILIGIFPLFFGLCFGIAAIFTGPTLLLGVALPFYVKGTACLLICIFQLNVFSEIHIEYEKSIVK